MKTKQTPTVSSCSRYEFKLDLFSKIPQMRKTNPTTQTKPRNIFL